MAMERRPPDIVGYAYTHSPGAAVTAAPQISSPEGTDERSLAALVEELLQIARISALEEMASGFAHELNQPIGAIATFAQAAQRMLERPEPMIPQAIEVLGHISAEAIKAGNGVHRIRNLFGSNPSARITCELPIVVRELMPLLKLLAHRFEATISVHVDKQLPAVTIDRRRIQHVVCTLVQNALEAQAGTPGPCVRIDLTGDRYAAIASITNDGPAIPDEIARRLFQPFFTTKQNGTGLGLASSRAIVEDHEGTIGFEKVDGGTRFWFRLPAATGVSR